MNREFVAWGIIAILVLILAFTVVYTNSQNNGVQNCDVLLQVKDSNISTLQNKLLVLQENEKYSSVELKKARDERNELQNTYNKLWNDATSCYWANYCLYYKEACVEHFESEDLTAEEIHVYYSDECDMMIRDWDTYSNKTSD